MPPSAVNSITSQLELTMGTRLGTKPRKRNRRPFTPIVQPTTPAKVMDKTIDWTRCIPFLMMHAAILFVFVVGVSPIALIVAGLTYSLRVFGLTGFYHRYFSHRSFKTSRWFQFVGAFIGSSAAQRGPLWWAAHHRRHHRESDQPEDVHSPVQHGFFWSHVGWFLNRENYDTDVRQIKDFWRFPELRMLDRHTYLAPIALAVSMYALGELIQYVAPSWNTNGWQMLVWGFVVSTIATYHITYCI
ncbi:MAG TPA: fatty acid desaturase, partial [Pirellulaceae bacterium]